ncbi:endonuclease/exonuclease/phosphatase family protein [Pseudoalteromonas sp. G4]|uniref:endonuclease/exonuclease/phosphatase family protein n=1 Tax=Pseudoalteromonas sp. G4 TaxID=2992761 RepID=UPI00237E51A5|nr:endonuclease/exonuclease/phosphatase family protein [Pseudoalteromonas sp. G4]MDE3271025.1 endonuclease/exonuclease/phosphatase family protein [Pseudoalteromonas sp. G4]
MMKVNRVWLIFLICFSGFGYSNVGCLKTHQTESINNKNMTIRVMTANIAHGRGINFSQLTTSTEEIKQNLDALSAHINLHKPSIVALQELDSPSWWSGNFDHAKHLVENTSFEHYMVTNHVDAWWGKYGTGILSNYPLQNCKGFTFAPSFPTTNKGYSYAEIDLGYDQSIGLVSLHLDFSRASVRIQQITELTKQLKQNKKPLIIMGDFNTDWRWQTSVVKTLSEDFDLTLFEPESNTLDTFSDKRIDWIIISHHFKFKHYKTVGAGLSDHLFVIADLIYDPN